MRDVKILRFEIKDSTAPDEIGFVRVNNAARKQVNGHLYLQVLKPTTLKQITIKLQGECLTTLKEMAPEAVCMREHLLSVKCQLINSQESILDAPKEFGVGEHCVPFAISIRQDLPSTQDYQMTNKVVSINYRIGAVLEGHNNSLSTLVRNASFSKPAADAYIPIKLKQFTYKSTTDMFPVKQVNHNGKREGKIVYGIVVPEKILVPLERLHIRGSVLPLDTESVVDHVVVELCQKKAIS
jgi:Arrestin (or S-antigen), N-terminal domain